MHPKMISALAHEVERDRASKRRQAHLRSQSHANDALAPHGASGLTRRLLAGVGLRPGLS